MEVSPAIHHFCPFNHQRIPALNVRALFGEKPARPQNYRDALGWGLKRQTTFRRSGAGWRSSICAPHGRYFWRTSRSGSCLNGVCDCELQPFSAESVPQWPVGDGRPIRRGNSIPSNELGRCGSTVGPFLADGSIQGKCGYRSKGADSAPGENDGYSSSSSPVEIPYSRRRV